MYDPVPATGEAYVTTDAHVQRLWDHAEAQQSGNARCFFAPQPPLPEPFDVLVEGAEYIGAWLETQPMGGAMWATRSVRLAVNNQLVFTRTQRSDGRFPHRVDCGHPARRNTCNATTDAPHPGFDAVYLQGLYMASPAVDVAWFLSLTEGNKAATYLDEIATSLERYDAYLWATRNDSTCAGLVSGAPNAASCPPTPSGASPGNRRGLLWSVGLWDGSQDCRASMRNCCSAVNRCNGTCADSGEDGCTKFSGSVLPIQSMDLMGYSHDMRRSLARIAALSGRAGGEALWTRAAEEVRNATVANLWREERSAMFYRDATDAWVDTLSHNTLRMMWHGVLSQPQADAFVASHLVNTSEFWTPMPLPSIAASDPHFYNDDGDVNNWSGPPQGLTLQRAIRALQAYGHHAEVTLIGRRLQAALDKGCASGGTQGCHFPQQIDPFTAVPYTAGSSDGYGPMMLSFLRYTALRAGVVPDPARGALLWSGVCDRGASTNATLTLGHRSYRLAVGPRGFAGAVGDAASAAHRAPARLAFECTAGVRVVTGLDGAPTAFVGVEDVAHTATLSVPGAGSVTVTVEPNAEWAIRRHGAGGLLSARLARAVPFVAPHP